MFRSRNSNSLVSVYAVARLLIFLVALSMLALILLTFTGNASAQTQNQFDTRINANAGILSSDDIAAPTSTISGAAGEFGSASITNGTSGLTIGDTITITLQVVDGKYHSIISSVTNIPIRINGENRQVQIIGGADIRGGTTRVDSHFETTNSPVRIVGAATDTIALQLTKSATDVTGLRAYLDTTTNKVIFKNTMPSPLWEFSPALTSANDITVYAHHIVIAATDSTGLLSYIDTAINAVAWDTLETATGTTIAEYVQSVSGEIIAHSERLVDATGTRLIDYIENRITSRINSISNLVVSGTITANLVDAGILDGNTIHSNNLFAATGTVDLSGVSNFIGFPTYDVDTELLQDQLDDHSDFIDQNMDDIDALELDMSAAQVDIVDLQSSIIQNDSIYYLGSAATPAVTASITHDAGEYPLVMIRESASPRRMARLGICSTGGTTLEISAADTIQDQQFVAAILEPSATAALGDGTNTTLIADFTGYDCNASIWQLWDTVTGNRVALSSSILSSTQIQIHTASPMASNQLVIALRVVSGSQTISAANPATVEHDGSSTEVFTSIIRDDGFSISASIAVVNENDLSIGFSEIPSATDFSIRYFAVQANDYQEFLKLDSSNADIQSGTIGNRRVDATLRQITADTISARAIEATSVVKAASVSIDPDRTAFDIFYDPINGRATIRSMIDLYLDPTNGGTAPGKIVPATVVEFPDFLGDKIRLWSHSYKLGISPFTLDYTSDKYHKWHSDTNSDAMILNGDSGDLTLENDITAYGDFYSGDAYKFLFDTVGDKILLYSSLYKIAISNNDFDFYSDKYFKFHSDTNDDAVVINADTGEMSLEGDLDVQDNTIQNVSGIEFEVHTTLTGQPARVLWLYVPE